LKIKAIILVSLKLIFFSARLSLHTTCLTGIGQGDRIEFEINWRA